MTSHNSLRHIPNILTIFRFVITPFFIFSFFQHGIIWKLITFCIFLMSTITDKIDGFLARKYGWETSLGKFLDPLADKVLITSAFICLLFYDYIAIWMVVAIVVRDFLVTWLRSYGNKIGSPVHTLEIARWKTGVQTVAIYIALGYIFLKETFAYYHIQQSVIHQIESWNVLLFIMLIVTLFTVLTGIIYIINNRHLLNPHK